MMVVVHNFVHADGLLEDFVAGRSSQGRTDFLAVTKICCKLNVPFYYLSDKNFYQIYFSRLGECECASESEIKLHAL